MITTCRGCGIQNLGQMCDACKTNEHQKKLDKDAPPKVTIDTLQDLLYERKRLKEIALEAAATTAVAERRLTEVRELEAAATKKWTDQDARIRRAVSALS